jgi:hypothetical protein
LEQLKIVIVRHSGDLIKNRIGTGDYINEMREKINKKPE